MFPNRSLCLLWKSRPSAVHVCLPTRQARLASFTTMKNRLVEKKESARCHGAMNVEHHFFFGIELQVMKGKTEVNEIELFNLRAQISPEILETKISPAAQLLRVAPCVIQRLSRKIHRPIKIHRLAGQDSRSCPCIPRSQIQKTKSSWRSGHFDSESRFDFAVMKRVVLDAEAINLPVREKIGDRLLHYSKIQPGSNTTNCCRPLWSPSCPRNFTRLSFSQERILPRSPSSCAKTSY